MSDTMLLGVLRMPHELAMADELSQSQCWSRAAQAADRIEADAERIADLEARLAKYEQPDDAEPVSEAWYMAEFSPRTSWEPLFVDTHVAVGFNAAGVVEFSVYPIPGSTTNVVIASCRTRGRVRRVLSALKGEP